MSKRAEEAAKEIFKDGIELFGRRDKNNNLVIHPETMVGILRNAAQRAYEQAEKDLALTWEDIQRITDIHRDVLFENPKRIMFSKENYEDTLIRFNQLREEK